MAVEFIPPRFFSTLARGMKFRREFSFLFNFIIYSNSDNSAKFLAGSSCVNACRFAAGGGRGTSPRGRRRCLALRGLLGTAGGRLSGGRLSGGRLGLSGGRLAGWRHSLLGQSAGFLELHLLLGETIFLQGLKCRHAAFLFNDAPTLVVNQVLAALSGDFFH